jgi:hypothetical protein
MEWIRSKLRPLITFPRLLAVGTLGSVLVTASAGAQGTFRNMDFEQSQIPQNQSPGLVSADLAFPFWTVYYGTTPQTLVWWRDVSAGTTEVSLLGQIGADPIFGGPTAIDGGYSAGLTGGSLPPDPGPMGCSIGQVGQIPTDAVSLLFKDLPGAIPSNPITVTIGGVSLPVFLVSNVPNRYALFGVDVSQFAGMQEDLRFSVPGYTANGLSGAEIDDIVFSTTPVPEPTTGALFALGGLLFRFRGRLTTARGEPRDEHSITC